MPIQRRPKRIVPRSRVMKNSVRHRVKDGESWETLALQYGLSTDQIIYFNFDTIVPEEVNWYLQNYVGCKKITGDGKNWMFNSRAVPGVIQIPPKEYTFTGTVITGTLPPRYFTVTDAPTRWTPPPLPDKGVSAKRVVSIAPWRHGNFSVNELTIKGRTQWGASDPIWSNEVIYYNTVYPLYSI